MTGIEYPQGGAVLPPEFDKALIGVQLNGTQECAVYDTGLVIEVLMETQGWDYDEALDWFYTNIEGAYMGPGSPVFQDESDEDDDQ